MTHYLKPNKTWMGERIMKVEQGKENLVFFDATWLSKQEKRTWVKQLVEAAAKCEKPTTVYACVTGEREANSPLFIGQLSKRSELTRREWLWRNGCNVCSNVRTFRTLTKEDDDQGNPVND